MVAITVSFSDSNVTPPVFVAGSFTDWQPVDLEYTETKTDQGTKYLYKHAFDVTPGEHQYKIRLGRGDWWVCDTAVPRAHDAAGNENNVLTVESVKDASSIATQSSTNQDKLASTVPDTTPLVSNEALEQRSNHAGGGLGSDGTCDSDDGDDNRGQLKEAVSSHDSDNIHPHKRRLLREATPDSEAFDEVGIENKSSEKTENHIIQAKSEKTSTPDVTASDDKRTAEFEKANDYTITANGAIKAPKIADALPSLNGIVDAVSEALPLQDSIADAISKTLPSQEDSIADTLPSLNGIADAVSKALPSQDSIVDALPSLNGIADAASKALPSQDGQHDTVTSNTNKADDEFEDTTQKVSQLDDIPASRNMNETQSQVDMSTWKSADKPQPAKSAMKQPAPSAGSQAEPKKPSFFARYCCNSRNIAMAAFIVGLPVILSWRWTK